MQIRPIRRILYSVGIPSHLIPASYLFGILLTNRSNRSIRSSLYDFGTMVKSWGSSGLQYRFRMLRRVLRRTKRDGHRRVRMIPFQRLSSIVGNVFAVVIRLKLSFSITQQHVCIGKHALLMDEIPLLMNDNAPYTL